MRENLELYGLPDEERYVEILTDELGATKHPNQAGAYIVESLPFHAPTAAGDHLSILSFNNNRLADSLVEASVTHGELFPDDILIRWTQEQDLILEASLGQLRGSVILQR